MSKIMAFQRTMSTQFWAYLKATVWSVRQLVEVAPFEFCLITIFLGIQGIVPGISILVLGKIVSWLATLSGGVTNAPPFTLLVLWTTLLFFENLLVPFIHVVRMRLNEKILTHCNVLLMERMNSFIGLGPFETPAIYDQIQFLKGEAKNRPLNFVYIIAGFVQDIVSIISVTLVCTTVSVWVPLWIIVFAIPQAFAEMNAERQSWDQQLFTSPQARKLAWLSSIPLDERTAKEVRLFGFGNFFLQSYRQLSSELCASLTKGSLKTCSQTFWFGMLSFVGNLSLSLSGL